MNLDRLKALIRLANNNPNEHEANLAARKACKLIAEKDFAILYANHIPRTAADKFKSKSYDPPVYNPFDTIFEEMFRRTSRSRPFTQGAWTDKAPHVDAPEPESWDRETKPHSYDEARYSTYNTNFNPDGTKKKKPEELRKCVRCGLEIMTTRLNENPWVCNPCHWKEYP